MSARDWHWFWLAWVGIGLLWVGINETALHHAEPGWFFATEEFLREWRERNGSKLAIAIACNVLFWPIQLALYLCVLAVVVWRRRAPR
jgi:hypothetical protein